MDNDEVLVVQPTSSSAPAPAPSSTSTSTTTTTSSDSLIAKDSEGWNTTKSVLSAVGLVSAAVGVVAAVVVLAAPAAAAAVTVGAVAGVVGVVAAVGGLAINLAQGNGFEGFLDFIDGGLGAVGLAVSNPLAGLIIGGIGLLLSLGRLIFGGKEKTGADKVTSDVPPSQTPLLEQKEKALETTPAKEHGTPEPEYEVIEMDPLIIKAYGVQYVNTDTDPLALRSGPSASSKKITSIPRGKKVIVQSYETDANGDVWAKVEYDGQTGYVNSWFLDDIPPTDTPVPSKSSGTTPLLDEDDEDDEYGIRAMKRDEVIATGWSGDAELTDLSTGITFKIKGKRPENYSHSDFQTRNPEETAKMRSVAGRAWTARPALWKFNGHVSAVAYHSFNHSVVVASNSDNIIPPPTLKRSKRLPKEHKDDPEKWDPATLGPGFERDTKGEFVQGHHFCMHYIDTYNYQNKEGNRTDFYLRMHRAVKTARRIANSQ